MTDELVESVSVAAVEITWQMVFCYAEYKESCRPTFLTLLSADTKIPRERASRRQLLFSLNSVKNWPPPSQLIVQLDYVQSKLILFSCCYYFSFDFSVVYALQLKKIPIINPNLGLKLGKIDLNNDNFEKFVWSKLIAPSWSCLN